MARGTGEPLGAEPALGINLAIGSPSRCALARAGGAIAGLGHACVIYRARLHRTELVTRKLPAKGFTLAMFLLSRVSCRNHPYDFVSVRRS